jgi:MbtH protein
VGAVTSTGTFRVVVNDERQYSIWATGRDLPPGWSEAGFTGSRQECLDHVRAVWSDMRPASVRALMEGRSSADER